MSSLSQKDQLHRLRAKMLARYKSLKQWELSECEGNATEKSDDGGDCFIKYDDNDNHVYDDDNDENNWNLSPSNARLTPLTTSARSTVKWATKTTTTPPTSILSPSAASNGNGSRILRKSKAKDRTSTIADAKRALAASRLAAASSAAQTGPELQNQSLQSQSDEDTTAAVKDSIPPQKSQLQNQSLPSQFDEEDSIFSGLDDGPPPFDLVMNHQTEKPKERTPANNTTRAYSHSLFKNARADKDISRSRVSSNAAGSAGAANVPDVADIRDGVASQKTQTLMAQRERFQRLRQMQQKQQQHPITSAGQTKSPSGGGDMSTKLPPSPTPLMLPGGHDIHGYVDHDRDGLKTRDDVDCTTNGEEQRESGMRRRGNERPQSFHIGHARFRSYHCADEELPLPSPRRQVSLGSPNPYRPIHHANEDPQPSPRREQQKQCGQKMSEVSSSSPRSPFHQDHGRSRSFHRADEIPQPYPRRQHQEEHCAEEELPLPPPRRQILLSSPRSYRPIQHANKIPPSSPRREQQKQHEQKISQVMSSSPRSPFHQDHDRSRSFHRANEVPQPSPRRQQQQKQHEQKMSQVSSSSPRSPFHQDHDRSRSFHCDEVPQPSPWRQQQKQHEQKILQVSSSSPRSPFHHDHSRSIGQQQKQHEQKMSQVSSSSPRSPFHRDHGRSRSFYRTDEVPQPYPRRRQQQHQEIVQLVLASPRALLLSVLNGGSEMDISSDYR
jgi:hypothetical protein